MSGWALHRRHPMAPALDGADGLFVPALVGVLVYLAAIVTAGMLLVGGTADRWSEALSARFTVQLATGAAPSASSDQDAADVRKPAEAALAKIRALPEVARAEPVDAGRLARELQPWLGDATVPAALLPPVIEVELRADQTNLAPAVRARLLAALPGATVDGGPALLEPALRLMRGIEGLTMLVLLVLAATLAACVVFATRARLAARAESIEILHLLGADDRILVGLMARQALHTALLGGFAGVALGMATMFAFAAFAGEPRGGGLAPPGLGASAWATVATLPFAAAAIAVLTARLTTGRALAAMP